MKFSIATVAFWQSVGFDTTNWRKSIDGTKALVHAKFASVLVDLDNENVITLDVDSENLRKANYSGQSLQIDPVKEITE